jgi:DnaJ-class molecular chaperone
MNESVTTVASTHEADGQQASDRECPACKGRTGQWRDDRLPTRWWHQCHVCCGKGRVQIDASLRPIGGEERLPS